MSPTLGAYCILKYLASGLFALLFFGEVSHLAAAQGVVAPETGGGWRQGRATFFGGPASFTNAFIDRGAGAFGDLLYGSCGFFQKRRGAASIEQEDIPYPQDEVAAVADIDPDFPGSCGRCYQVRCKPGLVIGNGTTPVSTETFYYMPSVSTSVKDTQGRTWPGNDAEADKELDVVCWGSTPAFVRIIDSCPQYQDKDGVVTPQLWCNGNVYHFDLSYYAFEKLAHPLYGVMNVEFRPVDCDSKQPIQFLPGYISKTVYDGELKTGWRWQPYEVLETQIAAAGAGLDGDAATCVAIKPNGGLTFECHQCATPGYQPFSGASSLDFWIRGDKTSLAALDPSSATPPGEVPPLEIFMGNTQTNTFCNTRVALSSQKPVGTQAGGWFRFSIPISAWSCPNQALVDTFGFSNLNGAPAHFCVDKIKISSSSTA